MRRGSTASDMHRSSKAAYITSGSDDLEILSHQRLDRVDRGRAGRSGLSRGSLCMVEGGRLTG